MELLSRKRSAELSLLEPVVRAIKHSELRVVSITVSHWQDLMRITVGKSNQLLSPMCAD